MPLPTINPPLLNSASPWATTREDLQALFDCPHTGAVTTRTSLLQGFKHDETIHQFGFFDPNTHYVTSTSPRPVGNGGSLNTLGYSPIKLDEYLAMITQIVDATEEDKKQRPFIVSVTGSALEVQECYRRIQATQKQSPKARLCMEINLSCPNIPGKPPPAYGRSALQEYLDLLPNRDTSSEGKDRVPIGIKTPPYTYHDQFQTLVDALLAASKPLCPVDFITATNTLGSSLVLNSVDHSPVLKSASGTGIGGMAGAPLHPLALGNVRILRKLLDAHEQLQSIDTIGVGGVADNAGFERMTAVGAKAVAVATALGREGISVFDKILNG